MQNNTEKEMIKNLPEDAKKRLDEIKSKLEKFKKKAIAKFDNYLAGIALMPPQKQEGSSKPDLNKISVLVLIDDTDSMKMSKQELKDKLEAIMVKIAKEVDKNIEPKIVIYSDLWQSCYDAKYDLLQLIAVSAPVYDKGMLAAIKIAEIHKSMVLKKFEKYIVSYVLSGSLVRGEATETSDIDVMIIIDDTDVKKMTRAELKDKLRAIIIGMGIEAGELTGIRNKLNIQVYILTDFWESLKEANPVIFTLLRDGVPFYDRGLFMPWKQMLKMGKIKPSQEAIDMFMSTGDQVLKRVHYKLKEIGMEDTYYAILTPSQAALMLYGVAPPAPRETAKLMKEIFVKKEKLLEESYVKILEHNIDIRKKLEHGTKDKLSGTEIDELLKNAEKYLKRIEKLFKQIENIKEKENIMHIYEASITAVRDILRVVGAKPVKDDEILAAFRKEVVSRGEAPEKYLRIFKAVLKAKAHYDSGKLTKAEIEQVKKESRELIRGIIEIIQLKKAKELDKAKIRVKHGDKFGEIIIVGKTAYIIHDLDNDDKEINKAAFNEDGSFGQPEKATLEEFEKAVSSLKIAPKIYIKEKTLEHISKIFGADIEILINS